MVFDLVGVVDLRRFFADVLEGRALGPDEMMGLFGGGHQAKALLGRTHP
jgi:hypothetical protein